MPSTDEPVQLQAVVRDVLTAVFAGPIRIDAIRAFAGGLSNRVHLVTTTEGLCVVKLRRAGPGDVLELDAEAELTRRAAAAGLAPEVLGTDARHGALVTAYRTGSTPWTRAAARQGANIRRAADLLRALHELPAALREFDAVSCARHYIEAARQTPNFDAEHDVLAAEFVQLAQEYGERYAASALCHNDLIADNILDDGALVLVDFEYAMRAAPILDLASFAAMNRLRAGERRLLLAAYYAGARMPFASANFDRVVRLVHLMAFFWARAAARQLADFRGLAEFGSPGAGAID